MTISGKLSIVVGLLLVVAVGAASYSIGRARAAGVPTPPTLTYAGTLTNATGEALNDTHNIQIELWNAASGGATPLCLTQPAAITLQQGRFAIALPKECSSAVSANPDLWVEVLVDGASLGRTKLGAVPYAIEADHATTATQASQASNFLVSGNLEVAAGATLKGPVIRTIARAHGNKWGSDYDLDVGALTTRVLKFTKTRADTGIRVSWTDNLRVTAKSGGDSCRWEIKFDNTSCGNPGALVYDIYYGGVAGMNHHRPDTLIGTCFGLGAGDHMIQVFVGPVPDYGQGDCATGWYNQYWALEAEEVY
jgi:hypothetical protein